MKNGKDLNKKSSMYVGRVIRACSGLPSGAYGTQAYPIDEQPWRLPAGEIGAERRADNRGVPQGEQLCLKPQQM